MNRNYCNALAAVVAMALLGGNVQAQSAQDGVKPAKAKKTKKTTASPGATNSGGKVKFISGSGETPGQRDARLKRECKGAVDAGACAGYTR
jgi:hypothetical protein